MSKNRTELEQPVALRKVPVAAELAVLSLSVAAGDALAQSPRILAKAGAWTKIGASGLEIYRAIDGAGSFIEIGCDVAQTLDHRNTGISLELDGKLPSTSGHLTFNVDGLIVSLPADSKSGVINMSGCPECARGFAQLWGLLRHGSTLIVVDASSSSASFSLRGTSRLVPPEPCPIGR